MASLFTPDITIFSSDVKFITQRISEALRVQNHQIYLPKGDYTDPFDEDGLSKADVVVLFYGSEIEYPLSPPVNVQDYYVYCQRNGKLCIPFLIDTNVMPLGPAFPQIGGILVRNLEESGIATAMEKASGLISKFMEEKKQLEIKSLEVKSNIEVEAPHFVNAAKNRLVDRANDYKNIATLYFTGAYFVIFLGVILGIIIYVNDKDIIGPKPEIILIVFFFIKSLVILSLVTAISKYSFSLGKAYMHEVLRLEDRIHAISFGEFYLNIYKERLKPEEVKEVFGDWNISTNNTAFMNQKTEDWDPKTLEKLLDVVNKAKETVK